MTTVGNREKAAGYQNWRHLLFLHWRANAQNLQSQLPDQLSIESFDGSAWLGLVPFAMERVRPWWSPAVPGISWFRETNIRTYVRHKNGQRGVWFFSLDADSRLAVQLARRFWHLNYIDARLSLSVDGDEFRWSGHRRRASDAGYDIRAAFNGESPQTATPGSLDEFLLERYILFTRSSRGRIYSGEVHHQPYPFVRPKRISCQESMLRTILPESPQRGPDHAAYCRGVDVAVSPLKLIPPTQ